MPYLTTVPDDLLSFIGPFSHSSDAFLVVFAKRLNLSIDGLLIRGIIRTLGNPFKHAMLVEMLTVPLMQVLHICDFVDMATRPQSEGIISEQLLGDDPPSMVDFLEVRVRKADEDLLQLHQD